jgi:uncharacterized YccA/Bax inhibitor family protein
MVETMASRYNARFPERTFSRQPPEALTMMRTANPALNIATFRKYDIAPAARVMTVQGTINRTSLLLVLVVAAAVWTWHLTIQAAGSPPMGWMIGGMIAGLILAVITIFKPMTAPVTAPIYALCEGLFLGGISAWLNTMYEGIVMQAVGLTFGVMFTMLALYSTGIIKVTEKLKMGIVAATGGVFLVYVVSMLLGFFGVNVGFVTGNSMMAIGFSVLVVIIAAMNLVLDFDLIDQGAKQGLPKKMEWYGAFALLVTLVWLYIEILRLLSKLRSR